MHLLRTLVLLLLSMALPLHAGAAALGEMPCPMQAGAAAGAQGADGPALHAAEDAPAADCCSGDGAGGSASACKAGTDCKAGGATLPAPAQVSPVADKDPPARTRAAPSRATSAPADIWRPPSLQVA